MNFSFFSYTVQSRNFEQMLAAGTLQKPTCIKRVPQKSKAKKWNKNRSIFRKNHIGLHNLNSNHILIVYNSGTKNDEIVN